MHGWRSGIALRVSVYVQSQPHVMVCSQTKGRITVFASSRLAQAAISPHDPCGTSRFLLGPFSPVLSLSRPLSLLFRTDFLRNMCLRYPQLGCRTLFGDFKENTHCFHSHLDEEGLRRKAYSDIFASRLKSHARRITLAMIMATGPNVYVDGCSKDTLMSLRYVE